MKFSFCSFVKLFRTKFAHIPFTPSLILKPFLDLSDRYLQPPETLELPTLALELTRRLHEAELTRRKFQILKQVFDKLSLYRNFHIFLNNPYNKSYLQAFNSRNRLQTLLLSPGLQEVLFFQGKLIRKFLVTKVFPFFARLKGFPGELSDLL